MADFEVWSVFWFLCVMCVLPVKNPLPVDEGVWSMCNTMKQSDMVHGFQQWQDILTSSDLGTEHDALQMMSGVQTCSAADVARELDFHWAVHRIVQDQLDYWEVCAYWVPKNPPDDDKAPCMGLCGPFLYPLDMLHWSKREGLEPKHG